MEQENKKGPQQNTALGIVDYWTNRSARFNTLYQQLTLPQVKHIVGIMEANEQMNTHDAYSLDHFKQQMQDFTKLFAQAKDFVKFLTTLQRQFMTVSKGELTVIEETLPSLLNGLKLIWTISKHIQQKEPEMEALLECISNEICEQVHSKIKLKHFFKMKSADALTLITQGISCLQKWDTQFHQTKMELEQEGSVKRWDFDTAKSLFRKPKHMRNILEDLKKACLSLKELHMLLGPDLKAVTGSSVKIDNVIDKIRDYTSKPENYPLDVFKEENEGSWKAVFHNFCNNIDTVR